MNVLKVRRFAVRVGLWAVCWFCWHGISNRGLEKLSVKPRVDQPEIYRWLKNHVPEIGTPAYWQWRQRTLAIWKTEAAKQFLNTIVMGSNNKSLIDDKAFGTSYHALSSAPLKV